MLQYTYQQVYRIHGCTPTQMDKKLGFEGQKRLKDHHQRHNRWLQHHFRLNMVLRWVGVVLWMTGAPLAVII